MRFAQFRMGYVVLPTVGITVYLAWLTQDGGLGGLDLWSYVVSHKPQERLRTRWFNSYLRAHLVPVRQKL